MHRVMVCDDIQQSLLCTRLCVKRNTLQVESLISQFPHFSLASVRRTAGNQFMSRPSVDAILLRSMRAMWVLSLALLVASEPTDHFLLKHFPLWLSCCFICLIFLLPQIAFLLFVITRYCLGEAWSVVFFLLLFTFFFSLGDSLWSCAFTHHLYADDLQIYLHPHFLP